MKSGLLLVLVAVVLGGLVGTLVVRDPGYVLLSYGDMALETSIWFALILLGAAYLAVRLVLVLLSRSRVGSGRFGSWLRQRRSRQARQQTVRGLLLMAEGQWAEAKKVLVAAAPEVGTPLINYLSAARAAHELDDMEGRDELLRKAHESTPGSRFAVGLTQAELQLGAEQWEQCLATLLELRSASPRHPQVLRMLAEVYQRLEDWQALIELLGELKRRRIYGDQAFEALKLRAWRRRFDQPGAEPAKILEQIPKELRREPLLVAAGANALIEAGAADEAEALIRQTLQHVWSDELLDLYGRTQAADPKRQLMVAESWLKERPNDARLLLALGRISLMNGEWAKAREYLEASLRLARSTEVYGELGRLCVAMGDVERGAEYLEASLRLGRPAAGFPSLPLPEPAHAGA